MAVEKTYDSKKQILLHKIFTELSKANKLIVNDDYIFKKNTEYRTFAADIYYLNRNIFRAITYLSNYKSYESEILNVLPETNKIIAELNNRFNVIFESIDTNKSYNAVDNDILINQWLQDYAQLKSSSNKVPEKPVIEVIYGLRCLIIDLKHCADEIIKATNK
jgi:hypothetical protein